MVHTRDVKKLLKDFNYLRFSLLMAQMCMEAENYGSAIHAIDKALYTIDPLPETSLGRRVMKKQLEKSSRHIRYIKTRR